LHWLNRPLKLTKKAKAFAICSTDVATKDNKQAKLGEG
jgi:hypothetical protein